MGSIAKIFVIVLFTFTTSAAFAERYCEDPAGLTFEGIDGQGECEEGVFGEGCGNPGYLWFEEEISEEGKLVSFMPPGSDAVSTMNYFTYKNNVVMYNPHTGSKPTIFEFSPDCHELRTGDWVFVVTTETGVEWSVPRTL